MKKYNIFWIPYTAHCIDLIFESITKRDYVKEVILKGRIVINFIYNHGWLLALMRDIFKRKIVRPGMTWFAINFIALESLLKKSVGMKTLFTSNEWETYPLSCTTLGKNIESLILNH